MEINTGHFKRNMLAGNFDKFVFNPGDNLQTIVERVLPSPRLHKYLLVTINQEPVTLDRWPQVVPGKEDVIIIAARPGGDDGGKTPLAIIAMIALTVFTYGGGLAALGLKGTSLAVGQGVVMLGGALAVNALVTPPPQQPGPAITQTDSADFLGIGGQRNAARLHGPVRSVYGTFRIAPDLAANPYVTTAGDVQTFYSLYDFGYGEVRLSDIRIGNTPIDYYKGARWRVRPNYTDGPLSLYKNDHKIEAMEIEITDAVTKRVSPASDTDELSLEIAFPQGLGVYRSQLPYGATDYFQGHSISFNLFIRKIDGSTGLIPYGNSKQVTFSHDVAQGDLIDTQAESFRFNNLFDEYTPPYPHTNQNDRGWTQRKAGANFEVQVDGRAYHASQARQGVKDLKPGQTFDYDGVTYTVTAATQISYTKVSLNDNNFKDRKKFNITISPPMEAGRKVYDKWVLWWDWPGNQIYRWEHRYSGGRQSGPLSQAPASRFLIYRTHNKAFVLTVNLKLPSAGEWEIELSRTGAPQYATEKKDRYLDKTVLVALKSISYRQPVKFKRPHTIMELRLTATDQLGGNLETLTALCNRAVNMWTGTRWTVRPTSNPAWIALDILQGDANPAPIPDNRIDLEAFKAWAAFCDRTSPQGDVYYQYDGSLDAAGTVFERLVEVMAAGRAAYAMRDNKISVIYENFPTVPKQLFTSKNSWGFASVKRFIKEPHAINVSYIDTENEWQLTTIPVYNDGYDEDSATEFENLQLPKVTRQTQAWRDARYFMAQVILRPESFTLNVDIENLIAGRGQLINLQHDVGMVGGTPARVVTMPAPDRARVDEPLQYDPAKTYKVRARYDDGTQALLDVQQVDPADPQIIEFTGPAPKLKAKDLLVFGEENLETAEFLIRSVTPADDFTAELDLIPVGRDIATADAGTIPTYNPAIQDEIMLYPDQVDPVFIDKELIYENRIPKLNITLQWQDKGSGVIYEIWVSEDGRENYQLHDTVNVAGNYIFWNRKNTLGPNYPAKQPIYIKIRAVNVFGFKLPLEQVTPLVFIADIDTTPPGKPLFFSGNINNQTMELSWLPPDDPDIAGYILKYSADHDNADWFRATIEDGLIPHDVTATEVNARLGSYLLKTIDTTGNESAKPALIRTTIPKLRELNLIEKIEEHKAPDVWAGNLVNAELIAGGIRLEKTGGVGTYKEWGTYTGKHIIDVGGIYECRIIASAKAYGAEDVFISTWLTLASVDPLAATKEGAWNVTLQVRTSTVSSVIADWPTMAAINPIGGVGSENWSGWQHVTAGNFTGRYFQFRIVLTSVDQLVTPHVFEAVFECDMPDRTISGHDITCPVGGMRVTFPGAFKNVPAVGISQTIINDSSDYYVLDNISQAGFDIEFFEAGAASIQAQFDYMAKGYGEVLAAMLPAIDAVDEDNIDLLPNAAAHLTRRDLLT